MKPNDFDLEQLYKFHSADSHLTALHTVFDAGAQYGYQCAEEEIVDNSANLKKQLDELTGKYEALRSQIASEAAAQRIPPEYEVNEKAVTQTMGMGKSFLR